MLHKAAQHKLKSDVINDIKLFLTIYCRIYCRKFFMLSNQTPLYKIKCIRITNKCLLFSAKQMSDFIVDVLIIDYIYDIEYLFDCYLMQKKTGKL